MLQPLTTTALIQPPTRSSSLSMSPFPQLDLHRLWIVADVRLSHASMNPLFLNPPFLQRPGGAGFRWPVCAK